MKMVNSLLLGCSSNETTIGGTGIIEGASSSIWPDWHPAEKVF